MRLDYANFPRYIGVVGSRKWSDPLDTADVVMQHLERFPKNTVIVSGGADGVDTWAEEAADILGFETIIKRVDQEEIKKTNFRSAAFKRNGEIVKVLQKNDGFCFAFKNLLSSTDGTGNTVDWCDTLQVPCIVFRKGEHSWQSPLQNQTVALNKRWSRLIL